MRTVESPRSDLHELSPHWGTVCEDRGRKIVQTFADYCDMALTTYLISGGKKMFEARAEVHLKPLSHDRPPRLGFRPQPRVFRGARHAATSVGLCGRDASHAFGRFRKNWPRNWGHFGGTPLASMARIRNNCIKCGAKSPVSRRSAEPRALTRHRLSNGASTFTRVRVVTEYIVVQEPRQGS